MKTKKRRENQTETIDVQPTNQDIEKADFERHLRKALCMPNKPLLRPIAWPLGYNHGTPEFATVIWSTERALS